MLCRCFGGYDYSGSETLDRKAVKNLLQQRGDNEPLGANWAKRFINRHLELKKKKGRIQESVRLNAFTPKAVDWYFDILRTSHGSSQKILSMSIRAALWLTTVY
jgi:hypothetical protein